MEKLDDDITIQNACAWSLLREDSIYVNQNVFTPTDPPHAGPSQRPIINKCGEGPPIDHDNNGLKGQKRCQPCLLGTKPYPYSNITPNYGL